MTAALSMADVKDGQNEPKFSITDIWAQHIAILAAGWALLISLFHRDVMHIGSIWWNSETFNHCMLIVPIIGWLVYQRWEQLAMLRPAAWLPGLTWLAVGGLAWLLGDAAGVGLFRQGGVIIMLQGLVLALLGKQISQAIAFPLFYMFFLVPFGEEFVPLLQTITAKMSMFLLAIAGVPATIDGIFITTPGGYFKVAEACAGVRFLVAMVALGVLVCNICFVSWKRRAMFMLACFIVPVFANSVRAWGTIMIAQNGNLDFAASFDHVFYGWIFFAIVITVVLAIGWRYFDKDPLAPAVDVAALQSEMTGKAVLSLVAICAALLVLAPYMWSSVAKAGRAHFEGTLELPTLAGWQQVPYQPTHHWAPRFDGSDHKLLGRYRNANGQEVDLYIALFDYQDEGRELVGYGQGAVDRDSDWAWAADLAPPLDGKSERIKAPGPAIREVDSYYRVGGLTTGAPSQVKWQTLKTRLLGKEQRAVAILISGEFSGKQSPRPAINAFRQSIGEIGKFADQMTSKD